MGRRSQGRAARQARRAQRRDMPAGGLLSSAPGGSPLELPGAPPPLVLIGKTVEALVKAHNGLAQQMQIMAAQYQTLLLVLKERTGLTDEEFGEEFKKVAEDLGFTVVDRDAEAEAEAEGAADVTSQANPAQPDGGAGRALPDRESDNLSPEGGSG